MAGDLGRRRGGVIINRPPTTWTSSNGSRGSPSGSPRRSDSAGTIRSRSRTTSPRCSSIPGGATGLFAATTGETPGTNRVEIAGDTREAGARHRKLEAQVLPERVPAAEFSRTTKERFERPGSPRSTCPPRSTPVARATSSSSKTSATRILEGAPILAPAEEAIRSLEIGNAMLLSGLLGRTVDAANRRRADGAGAPASRRRVSVLDLSAPPGRRSPRREWSSIEA